MPKNKGLSGAWHRAKPMSFIAASVLGLVALLGAGYYQVQQWTSLQSYWFRTYLWATLAPTMDIERSNYRLLVEVHGNQTFLPTEQDVVPSPPQANGKPTFPLAITEGAYRRGYHLTLLPSGKYDNQKIEGQLRQFVYGGQSLKQMAEVPLWWGLGVFAGVFLFSIPRDMRRAKERREGVRLQGRNW